MDDPRVTRDVGGVNPGRPTTSQLPGYNVIPYTTHARLDMQSHFV